MLTSRVRTWPPLLVGGMVALLLGAAPWNGPAAQGDAVHPTAPKPTPDAAATAAPDAPTASPADTAMLWKYVARCALKAGQSVVGPDGQKFEGALGMAPGWRDGICDVACQEKVSSCLFALTNPTGKHVQLSMLGTDPSLPRGMRPSDADLPYAFQEGAFFGNVFSGESFVCRGRDAAKGAAVKRWCAIDARLCNVLAEMHDAGSCEQACEMSCSRLSDGSRRCVANRRQGRLRQRRISKPGTPTRSKVRLAATRVSSRSRTERRSRFERWTSAPRRATNTRWSRISSRLEAAAESKFGWAAKGSSEPWP